MSSQDLSGKIALITGASRGIGAAIADTLAQAGAKVIGTATSENGAAAIGERLAQWGGEGRVLDSAAEGSIEALIGEIEKANGKLDILVNNAGITKDCVLIRMKDEDFDRVIAVNLRGAFVCTREAAKIMSKSRKGRIVNISSVVGQMGNAGQANYASAKAALLGLTKSCAKELAARQITVNAVTPGFIETDMTATLNDEVRASYTDGIPLKRMGSAEDVAEAVAFLASDKAAYITGQVLGVNGGMYC